MVHLHTSRAMAVVGGCPAARGQKIAEILDWAECWPGGGSWNTHLHYVLLNKGLCDASAAASGALVCGYDYGDASNGVTSWTNEPFSCQSVGDNCNTGLYGNAFISPTRFINTHHF